MIEHKQTKVALLWLTTAVGAVMFVTLQSFAYLNDFIRGHGAMPAVTFDQTMLWAVFIFYGAWLLPPLLALAGRRSLHWAGLLLGSALAALNTLGGIFDGMRDGGPIAFLAVVCIALPGTCAVTASWHRLRAV